MVIRVECLCGKRLTAADSAAGKKGRCPTCGRIIEIPGSVEQAVAAVSPPPGSAPPEGMKATCLIAEEEPEYLRNLATMFEQHGYQVLHTTSDSTEAMAKARELAPQVMVLDVKLKPMSGFRVVQALTDPADPRNEGVWQAIFVMLTPKARGREKQYALSLGVEIYIQKPFAPARVFPRIERRLRQHKGR